MLESSPVMGGAPAPGTLIGDKYLVGEAIASGGMGCLVEAEHLLLKRQVAIKFVLAQSGHAARARLLREARAMRALTSEHVARVFDLGVHEEAPYIVMELLSGTDLHDRVDDSGPMPIEEAVDCLLEASAAVAEAHAVGIVHRDLKPANLFLARTRSKQLVKVLDFGISKVPEPERDDDLHETAEDTVLGTPHFMSPEQLRNPAKIDERTDIWALGVTLFFLLTGELPFEGETRREITGAIFADEPLELRSLRPDAPQALSEVIAATLAKRPEKRTANVAALVEALLPFASKRGHAAAEQLSEQSPLPAEAPSRKRPTSEMTTEGGLASTLSPSEEKASKTPASVGDMKHDSTPPRRSIAVMAVIGLLGAMGLLWMARDARTASTHTDSPDTAASPAPAEPSVSPKEQPPPPELSAPNREETAATPTAKASALFASPTITTARPRQPLAPRADTRPSAKPASSTAPTASASSQPVDIDGLPILE